MRAVFFIPALAGLFLVSCQTGPATIIFKPGTLGAERQRDVDMCEIASFKEIPQNIATQINPGYSSPPTVQCNNVGGFVACNTFGGVNIPASAYNYDVNQGLRFRFVRRCLQAKGYSFVEKPICTADQKTPDIPYKSPDEVKCVRRAPN
ncbi:hypothetical protein [uncultured Pleomorphomonas sp.]|uniref:hypothetical protein n=1 Tax=uncultured Pleomorphomonas sp. TaxID=442121 RepID=UPI002582D098|nr:hypothetical protein [uncultured Pleomorphomonas sp.]